MQPKPFMEIFPAVMPVSYLEQKVLILGQPPIQISPATETDTYPLKRPCYETAVPRDLSTFGKTHRAPLGSIVHARSGDKANNSNVGFFVRHDDEYAWLRSMLTVEKFEQLLGEDWKNKENTNRIERCEFPRLLAVHL